MFDCTAWEPTEHPDPWISAEQLSVPVGLGSCCSSLLLRGHTTALADCWPGFLSGGAKGAHQSDQGDPGQ